MTSGQDQPRPGRPPSDDEVQAEKGRLVALADEVGEVDHPGQFDDPAQAIYAGFQDAAESPADDDELPVTQTGGALAVLRRGFATSPELKRGLAFTVGMALTTAVGKIVIPVLIQQILDKGITGSDGFRPGFTAAACAAAFVVVVGVMLLGRLTYIRLVQAAETMLRNLRVRAFAHIHSLSVADHDDAKRGVLTARVTSDIETIARFAQWGAIAWIVNSIVIVGVLLVMAVYSWPLALVTIVVLAPLLPLMRLLQRRQLRAYDHVRTRVGLTLSEISESVMGAGVVRAYGIVPRNRRRLHRVIDEQYRAEVGAARYFALMFPLGDIFGGVALAAVFGLGAWYGPSWGLEVGALVACLFLVTLILAPVAELGEVLDQTQTAIAGWRKVLDVFDIPVEVVEPDPGQMLPGGPVHVLVEGVGFAYRSRPEAVGRADVTPTAAAPLVLRDVDLEIPAGTEVAVVGETGSGKTTFVKLLSRLADPTTGRILLDGVDLREVAAASRHDQVRMVPQDGFLFDGTVRDNVLLGRDGATPDDAASAFERLGLGWWVERLPDGLDTEVGERGENLSVGERQLVALARAELADPGLLILDEATSAVDPETEQALATALARLAEGRTTISVAHRLSTAMAADTVLVFDAGRVVEQGTHAELVAAGGRYAELYRSWLGNTGATVPAG